MTGPLNFTKQERIFLSVAGVGCLALGLAVMAGWHTQNLTLIQVRPGFPLMNYNTALAVLCAGAGLLALAFGRLPLVLVSACWPTTVGALTIAQYVSETDVGIDQFWHRSDIDFGTLYPGRMGLTAALCVLFLGCALALLGQRTAFRHRPMLVGGLGLLTLGISLSVFLSYVNRMATGIGSSLTATMAIHASLGLGLLGLSTIVGGWRDYAARTPDMARSLRAGRISWMVMALSVAATGMAWFVASDGVTDRARARFDETVQQAHSAIVGRMTNYEQILVGGQGLFAASRSVGRDAWRQYVRSLDLDQRFPGIQAMGFARVLPHREKAHYIERVRGNGFPDFTIFPSGDRDVYVAVIYPEPFVGRNRAAMGYDMYSEPVRREAIERARDTGQPTVSGPLKILGEPEDAPQHGFVYLVPVYANGQSHTTVAERQAALVGFTVGAFRVDDLMSGVLGSTARNIRFEIFDGETTARDRLLYGDELNGNALPYRPTFQKTVSSEIGGRTWTFAFSTWPSFDAGVYNYEPVIVLIGGLVVSLLLFGITWSLTTTRERALALAELMTDALRGAQAQFRAITDHANDAMVSADGQGVINMWNRSASNVFGYSQEDVLGHPLTMLLADRSRSAHDKTLKWVADSGERGVVGQTVELVGRRKDGSEFALDLSLSTWTQGEQRFYTGIMRDITERKRTTERLDYLATHDALTGLPNRTLFADRLEQALTRSAWNKRLVAVMFLDLDRFKPINDTLGHDAGDLLLKTVATRLTAAVRDGDTVARQGGDEFTIVLIDMAQTDDVALVAQKILNAMAQPFDLNGHQMFVTFSIGIACYPIDGTDSPTLLKHADTALYRAKERGRNNYQLYSVA